MAQAGLVMPLSDEESPTKMKPSQMSSPTVSWMLVMDMAAWRTRGTQGGQRSRGD